MEPKKLRRIRIVLRVAAMLFGAIVLGCIVDKLYVEVHPSFPKVCYFDVDLIKEDSFCVLGIASGGVAIGVALLFILLDLATANKAAFMASALASLAVGILWIGCFSYLTKGWMDMNKEYPTIPSDIVSRAQNTLAFSFLSIPVWIIIAVLSGQSYREADA